MPSPKPAQSDLFRFAWFFYLFLAVAGAVWLGFQRGAIPLELFFDAGSWWLDLAWGLGLATALIVLWAAARRWTKSAQELEVRISETLGPFERSDAIALAFLSGIAEEIFFRGALQAAWGWFTAAILFALLHTGPGKEYRQWTVFAAVAGLALGGVTLYTGNLLAPIAAHITVNAVGLTRIGRLASQIADAADATDAADQSL